MPNTLMKCGHSTNATTQVDGEAIPICIICAGLPQATQVEDNIPDLTGRTARCSYYGKKCKSEIPSNHLSAFFAHQPDKAHDQFYCGCYGWD